METVNEVVGVRADFVGGKIRPIQFVWRSRQYKIGRVPLTFKRQDGNHKYLCFSVDCSGMMAELVMDLDTFSWRIGKCAPSYI